MTENEKHWFKRRRYGWGWTPVTWQGWLSVAFLLGIAIAAAFLILPTRPEQPTAGELILFFVVLVMDVATVTLVALCKGPQPRWRWGKKPADNPHEDF